jgi:hypothetical protein
MSAAGETVGGSPAAAMSRMPRPAAGFSPVITDHRAATQPEGGRDQDERAALTPAATRRAAVNDGLAARLATQSPPDARQPELTASELSAINRDMGLDSGHSRPGRPARP